MKRLKKIFFLITFLLGACGATNTGNPSSETPSLNAPSSGIGSAICTQLSTCHPGVVDQSSCLSALLADTNAPALLGLNSSDYANLLAIEMAYAAGNLQKESTNAPACLSAISNLSCQSALVSTAYDALDPTNYSSAITLLNADVACSDFFTSPASALED